MRLAKRELRVVAKLDFRLDVFQRDDLVVTELEHPIDQQERIAMRQVLENLLE